MSPITGYNGADLPNDVLMDSGVLYISGTPIGVSRGGWRFNVNREVRQLEYDGRRSPERLGDRIVGYRPVISGQLLEFDTADIQRIEFGAAEATAGTPGTDEVKTYTPLPASTFFSTGHYLDNVRLVFARGSTGYAAIYFPHALIISWDLASQDKDEAVYNVEIEARLGAAANRWDAPHRIELRDALPV